MTTAKSGLLGTTLATWIYLLDEAGHRAEDDAIRAACAAIREAAPEDADALGMKLAGLIEDRLDGDDPEAVAAFVEGLFGEAHVTTDFGPDRAHRISAVRSYQFQTSLPWVAGIIERFPTGEVGLHWVLVTRVTDHVHLMDPYPWDDLDEAADVPLVEFMVKWELAGCPALAWRA